MMKNFVKIFQYWNFINSNLMKRLLLVAALLLLFGCLQPAVKLGCCMKANATESDPAKQGCVMYNTTSFATTDAYFSKCGAEGGAACTNWCDTSRGGCNVSVKVGTSYQDFMVPVCTLDQLQACISSNCTAMLCGDFDFKPRVAPAMGTESDMKNAIPPDLEEKGGSLGFYNAQCRFLLMDATFNRIMKNSKSQINVFRMGIGGSFDEYDQYRYFFPMSDKYCNLNPKGSIDRYMNYIGSDLKPYDPLTGITENCLDDSKVLPPFNFSETSTPRTSKFTVTPSFTYTPKVADVSNYKRAYYARVDERATAWGTDIEIEITNPDTGMTETVAGPTVYSYYLDNAPFVDPVNNVYKKLDDKFYKRYLSIAHAARIYGITKPTDTRAPFECDVSSNDCYSGSCSTQTYVRSVMVRPGFLVASQAPEVVTDCTKTTDELGITRVICPPTKSVSVSSGTPPTKTYATVTVTPYRVEVNDASGTAPNYDPLFSVISGISGGTELDDWWNGFPTNSFNRIIGSNTWTVTGNPVVDYDWKKKKVCSTEPYTGVDNETYVWCPRVVESPLLPPVGGTVFFGKTDGADVTYNGDTIIGYALASSDYEFNHTLLVQNCNLKPGRDYVRVSINNLPTDLPPLMAAFKPYFEQRVKAIRNNGMLSGCKASINAYEAVVASMPWVVSYKKQVHLNYTYPTSSGYMSAQIYYPLGYHMSSSVAQAVRADNPYDFLMDGTKGTSSCDLQATANDSRTHSMYLSGKTWTWGMSFYYTMALSKSIYLIKYNTSTENIGSCAIDKITYLPMTKTFGWCEPCTTSTLAFQNITAANRSYMPRYTGNVQDSAATNVETICTPKYSGMWLFGSYISLLNASCFNRYITDVQDYNGLAFGTGAPRTRPEATIMKERLGNYLKSGVMPVIDMSDASNWNLTNTIPGVGATMNYTEYDFKRLFGEMGAVIVIVGHVKSKSDAQAKAEEILERGATVKDYCFGCLTAFHVDNPASNETFRNITKEILLDPRSESTIDMVTFDYSVTRHPPPTPIAGLENRSNAVVDDIASYGRIALQLRNTPTMVVGFNVDYTSFDPNWDWYGNYSVLFDTVVRKQNELIKAGVTGIIYSPVRTVFSRFRTDPVTNPAGEGIVLITGSDNIGHKTEKFCAMQDAMYKMSTTSPIAVFNKAVGMEAVNCTACTSVEVMLGECGPPEGGGTLPVCDNNETCSLGDIPDANMAKCPDNAITPNCRLCSEMPGNYVCTMTYANGTVQTLTGAMSDIQTDMYMDVIAGIPKPYKCCLRDEASGLNYTYMKSAYGSPQNKPLVFPKSGDPNTDCGVGTSISDMTALTGFCGVRQTQIKDYDINCTITG